MLDLNAESTRYLNAIGESNAQKYNPGSSDKTHLNAKGTAVFGRLVADLVASTVPALKSAFKTDEKASAAIKAGKFY